ncbi:Uncharacterised protein [Vibrio cholerae]|nr:Uncharacterised protein [Vibrio cholerae]
MQHRAVSAFGLQHVCDHVAVRQNGAFRHTGCTASVLQEGNVFTGHKRLHVLQTAAFVQRFTHRNRAR